MSTWRPHKRFFAGLKFRSFVFPTFLVLTVHLNKLVLFAVQFGDQEEKDKEKEKVRISRVLGCSECWSQTLLH